MGVKNLLFDEDNQDVVLGYAGKGERMDESMVDITEVQFDQLCNVYDTILVECKEIGLPLLNMVSIVSFRDFIEYYNY